MAAVLLSYERIQPDRLPRMVARLAVRAELEDADAGDVDLGFCMKGIVDLGVGTRP